MVSYLFILPPPSSPVVRVVRPQRRERREVRREAEVEVHPRTQPRRRPTKEPEKPGGWGITSMGGLVGKMSLSSGCVGGMIVSMMTVH